jgi:hypothetical protein
MCRFRANVNLGYEAGIIQIRRRMYIEADQNKCNTGGSNGRWHVQLVRSSQRRRSRPTSRHAVVVARGRLVVLQMLQWPVLCSGAPGGSISVWQAAITCRVDVCVSICQHC